MPLNRIQPAMPADAYVTYGMSMPMGTHWRPATCEEADCQAYRSGWVTTVDTSTDLGKRQYDFITHDTSRRYSMQKTGPTEFKFVYGPGYPCFARDSHRVPLERPARFYVTDGDWRGNPRGTRPRVHQRAEDWVEDFSEHADRIATVLKRG